MIRHLLPIFLVLCWQFLALLPAIAEMTEAEVSEWLQLLRDFKLPEPGPIDPETAQARRMILEAPLEEMPPDIRAGYILAQLGIYRNNGDWDGFTALRHRVTDPETWQFAPEDLYPLERIFAYYSYISFPPPGGRSVGEDYKQFWQGAGDYWTSRYRSDEQAMDVLRYAFDHADHKHGMAAFLGYQLAWFLKRHGQETEAEAILQELDSISLTDIHAAPFYNERGQFRSEEALKENRAGFIQDHRAFLKKEKARESMPKTPAVYTKPSDNPTTDNPFAPGGPHYPPGYEPYNMPTGIGIPVPTSSMRVPKADEDPEQGGHSKAWIAAGLAAILLAAISVFVMRSRRRRWQPIGGAVPMKSVFTIAICGFAVLAPSLAAAAEVRAAIPSFDEEGRINLMLVEQNENDEWAVRPLELPPVHGQPVDAVDFCDGRLVLESFIEEPQAQKDSLPWSSVCMDLAALKSSSTARDLVGHLTPSCPHNSHTLTSLRSQLDVQMERLAEELGEGAKPVANLDYATHSLLAGLHWRAIKRQTIFLFLELPDSDPKSDFVPIFTFLFLLDFEKGTVAALEPKTTKPVAYVGAEILHDRYLCVLEKDAYRATEYETKKAKYLRPGLKGLRACVYDTDSGALIFRSPDSYLGLTYRTPEINPQGTYVLWQNSDLPYDVGDGKTPHGDDGVSVFDVSTGEGKRMTRVGIHAAPMGWMPDGERFLYVMLESGAEQYYLGNVNGTSERLTLSLDGVESTATALRNHYVRAWEPSGDRFLTVRHKPLDPDNDKHVYDMQVILTDIAGRTSRVVATYRMVQADTVKGWGVRPYWIK